MSVPVVPSAVAWKSSETSTHWHDEPLGLKTRFWTSHWYSMASCHMISVQSDHCGANPALPRFPLFLLSIDWCCLAYSSSWFRACRTSVNTQEWPSTLRHCWALVYDFCFNCMQIKTFKSFNPLGQKQIDAEQEVIRLCSTEPTEVKDLPMRIPKDSARYHFFLYKHSHEGDYLQSTGDRLVICVQTRTSSDTVCVYVTLISFNFPLTLSSLHLFYARLQV